MNQILAPGMTPEKKLAIVVLIVGLVIGYGVRASTESDTFMLKESGQMGVVYKIDTHTGQTWMVMGGTETPVK